MVMYLKRIGPHKSGRVMLTRTKGGRMEGVVRDLLEAADVRIGGDRPWDLQVHEYDFYRRALRGGVLALGEAYMDGWWDCDALDQFVARVLRAGLRDVVAKSTRAKLFILLAHLTNRQSSTRAFEVGERHYDLGDDLFDVMLDRRRTYSCGYWKDAATLDEAQEAKLELICRKIGLKPGQHVLDVGCGWGSFIGYAAEKYGVKATGITVSREQADYARERLAALPVEVRLQDYRDIEGTFDHVVSVGMFEHVGVKNYRTFMEVAHRCLADDGLLLLHTIMSNISGHTIDPWTEKYIFPNAMLPSPQQIGAAAEHLFIIEDVHNFGADYDPTLLAWHRRFEEGWGRIAERYGERFRRMWRYYLLTSAGGFRIRRNGLWQVVLSKNGVPGGYRSVR